jgi:hypothetical protein
VDATTEESLVQFILGGEPQQDDEATEDEDTEAAPLDATDEETGEEAEPEETEADDEDVEEAEEPDVPEQPDLHTVKVNGVEKKVTLEELKRDYSGQQYVQQRMQEAASKIKEVEQMQQAVAQERQAMLALVQQISAEGVAAPPKLPDPKLAETDPVKYIKEQARYQAEAVKWQQQQARIQAERQRQAQLADLQLRQQVAQSAERLKAKIPDFADPKRAEAISRELASVAREYGFNEAELNSIYDDRSVLVLHDAMQWRKLQSQKAQPVQRAEAPKVVRPKAVRPESPKASEAKVFERAKKTQSPDAWVEWLTTPSKR